MVSPMTKNGFAAGALVWLLATAWASAQDAAVRAPHVGKVRNADGSPVPGAAVTFVSGEGCNGLDPEDVVPTMSDAHGRFRVALWPGRHYVAWATQQHGDGQISTVLTPRGASSTDLEFAADVKAAPSHWRLEGCEAWRAHGALRVQLKFAGSRTQIAEATVGEEATVKLPPLPEGLAEARFFVADRFVHADRVFLQNTYALPAPQTVRVHVVDGAGKGLPLASLQRLVSVWPGADTPFGAERDGNRYELAVTDAEGEAELLVAHRSDPFRGVGYPAMVFVAGKAGFGESVSGFGEQPFHDGVLDAIPPPDAKDNVLTLTLAPKESQRGVLTTAAGRLPAGLRCVAILQVPHGANSFTSVMDYVASPVAADGSFVVQNAMPKFELEALYVPGQLPVLAPDDPFRKAVLARTMVLPPMAVTAAQGLDLRRLVPLRLQLLDATAGPAMGAAVVCTPLRGAAFVQPGLAMQAEANGSGQLVLPTMPGTWLVLAVHDDTWAKAVLEIVPSMPPQVLHLVPMDHMVVRVVDGDGKPVAGARFTSSGASWGGGGDAEQSFMCDVGYHIGIWSMLRQRTDADGRAVLPFLVQPQLRIDFQAGIAERRSAEEYLVAGEDKTEIVLR